MATLRALPSVIPAKPEHATLLKTFSCGGSSDAEAEVDEIALELAERLSSRGNTYLADLRLARDGELLIFVDEESDSLVGVSQAYTREDDDYDCPYLALIALAEEFRGHRLPDGSRIGAFILHETLQAIFDAAGGETPPAVWALIENQNLASKRLFKAFGFERDMRLKTHDLWLRPDGVPLAAPPWT